MPLEGSDRTLCPKCQLKACWRAQSLNPSLNMQPELLKPLQAQSMNPVLKGKLKSHPKSRTLCLKGRLASSLKSRTLHSKSKTGSTNNWKMPSIRKFDVTAICSHVGVIFFFILRLSQIAISSILALKANLLYLKFTQIE